MRRGLVALSTVSLLLAMMAIPVAADHQPPDGPNVTPTLISGNPSCPSAFAETKIEPVASGTYPGAFGSTIQITVQPGNRFIFVISGALAEIVLVKGGPDANSFDYPSPGIAHDDGLHAPNRTSTAFYGLSHISFCLVDTVDAELTTTSNPNSTTVLPGTSVSDTATVTGITDGAAPTGSVTFFLCQPSEVTAAGCPSPAGTQVGAAKTLGGAAGNPPSVSVTSDATTNTTTEGTYCWRAVYSGDENYNAVSHTNTTSECFTVDKATPNIATTSSETGTILPGTSVSDTVTVSGPSGAPTPTGTVDFFLCQPSEVTSAGCPTSAGTKIGATKNLDGSGQATSDSTSNTTTEGTYCWRAEYSGDGVYDPGSHTNTTTECFTVAKNVPSLTTQPWVIPQDDATLSDLEGSTFTTLTFELFDNNTCTGDPVYEETVNVTGNGTYSTSNTGNAATDGFAITSDGTFYWVVSYAGDDNNEDVSSDCGDEVVVVDLTPNPAP